MLKDLFALVQLIMNLEEKNYTKKRNLMTDFVEPIFSIFRKVHDDYAVTFRKYKDRVELDDSLQLSIVVKLIQEDSFLSQGNRNELFNSLVVQNTLLSEFIREIAKYLDFPTVACSQSIQPWSNARRSGLAGILEKIDQLTPTMIANTLLITDINNVIQSQRIRSRGMRNPETLEYLLESLDRIITDDKHKKILANTSDSNNLEITVEIKRYLAAACIEFITQETQDNFSAVNNSYWRLKFSLLDQDAA